MLNKLVYSNCAGLANPAPIIQTFYAEEEIFNNVKLDGVVTLVDAKHATIHLDEIKPKGVVNEAIEQIAYADRIIVNKVGTFLDCSYKYQSPPVVEPMTYGIPNISANNCPHY